jgi:uncharacterized SAM-binding protein YcdF (DUF218 family)
VRLIRRHPVLTAIALLLLVAASVVGYSAITVWRAAHRDDASHVDRADVIVVLGAAQYNGDPSPVLQGRLDHAVLLWRQDRAGALITVGANQPGDRSTEAEAGRDYLVSQGVPAGSVVAIPQGHTTFESMAAAAGYMQEHGLSTAFLVSDPWHNARVKAMADDLGITGYASATWTSGAQSEQTRGEGYVRETFAYLYYLVFGG